MKNFKLKPVLLPLMLAMPVFAANAADSGEQKKASEQDVQSQLETLQRRLADLENKDNKEAQRKENYGVTLYGSLRPALTYSDFGDGESSTDVTDFFSRVGFKGDIAVNESITAFYQGEWDIDVEADADFGDARLGFAGLRGSFGQVAIGKQWSPHYNIVAEVTDIFNNRSSPFGYDEASPFRTNQMVTYSYTKGGFKLDAGLQFNGSAENSAGGDNSQANDVDHVDSGSIGVGYSFGDFYVGASYLDQELGGLEERDFRSIAGSWKVNETIYLAATYQDIERDTGAMVYNQSSFDVAASFSLPKNYTFKTSYFDWDGDGQGRTFDGYNLTLENQLNDSVRVFVEWLSRDIEDANTQNHLSVGIRYDFEGLF
ncbi:porin [Litorilituus lipolyticus]|uniref:Porin n=1 Tax=Litorilituus lipolyticus TaxID=2491017 RepID=A0A502LA61_9GAMM|nr:porin [Litorilituus lipolyticus]TPH19285.1 porin [Litorilituus lipolyticus]